LIDIEKGIADKSDPDALAIRLSAYAGAVRDWRGDSTIGGEIAVAILERSNGWRWFRRPEFCPER